MWESPEALTLEAVRAFTVAQAPLPGYRGDMTEPVTLAPQVVDIPAPLNRSPLLGQQDFAELGAILTTAGLPAAAARAFVAQVQQTAIQAAIASSTDLLGTLNRVHAARVADLYQRIQLLRATVPGYVRRDQVLMAIQQVFTSIPQGR